MLVGAEAHCCQRAEPGPPRVGNYCACFMASRGQHFGAEDKGELAGLLRKAKRFTCGH